jgi:hypothetical protein
MLEPLRPQIDKIIFKYAASRVFEGADFVELKEPRPHVRLGPKLAREVAAQLSLRKLPFSEFVKAARKTASWL